MVNVAHFDPASSEAPAPLADLDRDGTLALVDQAVDRGASLDTVVAHLLTPGLVEVGQRWVDGEIGAAEGHAAASITRAALIRAGRRTPPTGRPLVAVCCPNGELHRLPVEMVAALLRARGWPAEEIAPPLPDRELEAYLDRRRPVALVLGCTTPCGFPGAARAIGTAHEAGVPVLAGGRAFGRDETRASRLGAAAWAPEVGAAERVLETWLDARPTLTWRQALTEKYLAFEASLPDIGAQVRRMLRRSAIDRASAGSAQDQLDLMLRHLGAALLVDDRYVFEDYLAWRLELSRARHAGPADLVQELEAVAAVLDSPGSPGAAVSPLVAAALQQFPTAVAGRDQSGCRPHTGRSPGSATTSQDLRDAPAVVRSVADVDVQPGQAFADLLFLAALSCQAPMAVVSVAQPDGSWSTLSYGVDRTEPLRDPELFAAVAAGREPVELSDALGDERLAGSPLSTGPLGVRYFYGIPLRGPGQAAVGLLGVLDRRARELSSREQQAIAAVARQLAGQLALRRRARKPLSGADDVDGSTGRRQPDETVGGSPAPSVGSGRHQHLLRSHEVALLFDVTGRTVVNWASANKLASLRTAGGHLRFRSEDVLALLAAHPPDSGDEGSPPGP